jgi:hypothetical protein
MGPSLFQEPGLFDQFRWTFRRNHRPEKPAPAMIALEIAPIPRDGNGRIFSAVTSVADHAREIEGDIRTVQGTAGGPRIMKERSVLRGQGLDGRCHEGGLSLDRRVAGYVGFAVRVIISLFRST